MARRQIRPMNIVDRSNTTLLVLTDIGFGKATILNIQSKKGRPILANGLDDDYPSPIWIKTVNYGSVSLEKLPHFLHSSGENFLKVERAANTRSHCSYQSLP